MIEVYWNCPKCGTQNLDLYDETAFPPCEKCGESFEWDDLLSDEEMDKYNNLWIVQERGRLQDV